jgi:hypothetical protein
MRTAGQLIEQSMTSRVASIGAWCMLALTACGQTSEADPTPGGAGASGGASGGGPGTLLPPTKASDTSSEIVGASSVKCAGTPTPDPSVVRACLLASSCSPDLQATFLSDCIAKALPLSNAFPACAADAQNCEEMSACLGHGYAAIDCPAGAEFVTDCVGTQVVRCFDVPRSFHDCAVIGATCAHYSSNEDGVLDSAGCVVAATCTPTDGFVCDGTKRVWCDKGVGFGEDCAARGLDCVDTDAGAVCTKSPASCVQPGTATCDESGNGTYCDAASQPIAVACALLGLECQAAPEAAYGMECVNPACPAADAKECFEECDGSMAHLCLGGQRLSVDCRGYGFRTCSLDTRAGAGDRARCGIF